MSQITIGRADVSSALHDRPRNLHTIRKSSKPFNRQRCFPGGWQNAEGENLRNSRAANFMAVWPRNW